MTKKSKAAEWLTADGLKRIEGWARDGLINEQIAANVGVAERTWYDWQRAYPQILQAIQAGRAPVDFEVENALLKSALGHYEKVSRVVTVNGVPEVMEVDVYFPPSVAAQRFWLTNRRPDVWRDKRKETVAVDDEGCGVIILPAREAGSE